MKYLTLIYEQHGGLEALTSQAHDQLISQHNQLMKQSREQGVYQAAVELKPPQSARSVKLQKSSTVIHDGPFAEAKEYFIGFYLFDCTTLDDALALARRIPTGRGGGMEIRPLDENTECAGNRIVFNPRAIENKSMFAILNYHAEAIFESYSEAELAEMIASNFAMAQKAANHNEYVCGYKLMPSATATSLRGENNHRETFDGPFCEAKEVLLGFHMLACNSQQVALDYAKMLGDALTGVIEVRPINFIEQASDVEFVWNSKN
jgi:hypothetical protein